MIEHATRSKTLFHIAIVLSSSGRVGFGRALAYVKYLGYCPEESFSSHLHDVLHQVIGL